MNKWLLFGSAVLVLAFAIACGTARLDEKLDEEYMELRIVVDSAINGVDTLAGKMRLLIDDHNLQDIAINKAGLSRDDREKQSKHTEWIKQYETELAYVNTWIDESFTILASHDSLEETHTEIASEEIKTDHQNMLEQLQNLQTKADEVFKGLLEADSIIHSFYYDHSYLHDKYDIISHDPVEPPKTK